jgi:hypothetical protein
MPEAVVAATMRFPLTARSWKQRSHGIDGLHYPQVLDGSGIRPGRHLARLLGDALLEVTGFHTVLLNNNFLSDGAGALPEVVVAPCVPVAAAGRGSWVQQSVSQAGKSDAAAGGVAN